jgi:transketolase
VIIAHTVKGKGLSLAEGVHTWHSIVPSADDFERARQELEADELDLLDADGRSSADNSGADGSGTDINKTGATAGASTNGVSA